MDINIPYIKVDDTKEYLNSLLKLEYESIVNNLFIIGITGTNGKTTSAYLTYQMLNNLGIKCAYIGTLGYINSIETIHTNNTTPDILNVYKLLVHSYDLGITHIVMEVSSHSLSMNRLYGINFNIACFTNLTIDHLDYHKDMTNYLNSKLLILNHLKDNSITIYNNDDEKGYKFKTNNSISYGFNGDFKILNYKLNINETILKFSFNNNEYEVLLPFSSTFNIYNYLLMVSIVNYIGFSISDIINNTKYLTTPKGRCETYKINDGYVVIDYAHTPDAIEKIINSYNKIKKGKLITIFGCGGNRDKSKRSIMGNISTTLSDHVIITNDNPRNEDEYNILKDILKGIKKDNYEIELDRSLAIKKGINMLNKNDILLILGKGHESEQIIKDERIHFSDIEEVLKYKKED